MFKADYIWLNLINPFMALVKELSDFKSNKLPIVLMLFCGFYSATQMLGKEGEDYKDSSRYRDKFYAMHDQEVSWESFRMSIFDGETTFDVIVPLVSFIVATVTRNEKILFMIFGVIFGYFYGNNIRLIIQNVQLEKNRYLSNFFWLLIFAFSLVVAFWSGLNGIRMWTGAHVFFYGAFRLLKFKELKSIYYIFLSVLFHFSYFSVGGIVLFFYFTPFKKYTTMYFVLFVVTFFLAQSNMGSVTELINNLTPSIFKAKTENYTKEVYVESFQTHKEEYSWHARIYEDVLKYVVFYLISITFLFNLRSKILDLTQNTILSFSLILFSFANTISKLPSGGRFYKVAFLFAFIPITYYYVRSKNKKWYHYTTIPFLFWLIVTIRDGFDHFTLATFLSNPLLVFLNFLDQKAIIEYIK
jgi:hypothetical protein